MKPGDSMTVSGCFTKEKFIAGRTLAEIESILGFHKGRLLSGAAVVALNELPDEFELAGYSQVATHRHSAPTGLDIAKLKAEVKKTWATAGFERLVKVLPTLRHNDKMLPDIQYPPGRGAPQWITKRAVRGTVVAVITAYPGGRYVPGQAAARA